MVRLPYSFPIRSKTKPGHCWKSSPALWRLASSTFILKPSRISFEMSKVLPNPKYSELQLGFLDSLPNKPCSRSTKTGMTSFIWSRSIYHDQALIDEFRRRGIDVSAIFDGKAIIFAHPVRYDIADNRLATIGWKPPRYQKSTLAACSWQRRVGLFLDYSFVIHSNTHDQSTSSPFSHSFLL